MNLKKLLLTQILLTLIGFALPAKSYSQTTTVPTELYDSLLTAAAEGKAWKIEAQSYKAQYEAMWNKSRSLEALLITTEAQRDTLKSKYGVLEDKAASLNRSNLLLESNVKILSKPEKKLGFGLIGGLGASMGNGKVATGAIGGIGLYYKIF